MPTYEYRCDSCGQTFEVRQRFSDEPLTRHDGCGGKVERLISAPALQFKGSGWYVTDYARGGKSSESSKSDKPESKTESKSESKSEAPASTTSNKPSSGSDK